MLVDNHGYASIGALSRSVGVGRLRHPLPARARTARCRVDAPDGDGPRGRVEPLPVDLAANAESLGARVLRARTIAELRAALDEARAAPTARSSSTSRPTATRACPSYESWWDVPVAEVGDDEAVRAARADYEQARAAQRAYVEAP